MLKLLLISFVLKLVSGIDLTVVTSKGPIQGQRGTDGEYTTFFGIPYAKVDLANPFGPSQPYPNFETAYQANNSNIMCAQTLGPDISYELDCLVLNIWVPDSASVNKTLPVFVWIHGGLYAVGSGGLFGGQHLIRHDIIVVTINYRLGPYGFLCINDPRVPCNQGLKDQISALRWIKENIGAFGGDADLVTIGGQSAGGGAVEMHLYSGYETLFKRVIIESASMFTEGHFITNVEQNPIKLVKEMGYETNNSVAAFEYMLKAPVKDMLEAFKNLINRLEVEFAPCKERDAKKTIPFLTADPYHLNSSRIKNTDILVGYNNKENYRNWVLQNESYYNTDAIQNLFRIKIKNNYNIGENELDNIVNAMKRFYLGPKKISIETMMELVDFMTDFLSGRSVENSVNKDIQQGAPKVYKYLFKYTGASEYKNYTGVGVAHGDELAFIFEGNFNNVKIVTDQDKLVRDRMTLMWANFVKFGDPTPSTNDLLPVKWTPITSDTVTVRPYLEIDSDLASKENVFHERTGLWYLFITAYAKTSIYYED